MKTPSQTRVAVLMGGWSPERDVSLDTGAACGLALRRVGYNATEIDVNRDICDVLGQARPDVVFNALHGRWGEDGTVQGVLETLEIPYTHSGVLASALAMDKERAKVVFASAGLPVAESRVMAIEEVAQDHPIALPYVIKPVAQGSSVGVFIVDQTSNGPQKMLLEQRDLFGDQVMVERYIPGRELTCAVMGDVALGVTEIIASTGFYDYRAKYAEGGSQHILPADLPQDVYRKVQRIALEAHKVLGCRGVTRADFRYDDTIAAQTELILLEVNTQPGMTKTSLVPEQALHAGHSFEELAAWMVQDATCNR